MAGYSGTPLSKKLGIKEGMTISILNSDFVVPGLPMGVTITRDLMDADIFVIFVTEQLQARKDFGDTLAHLSPEGAIWMAWPKKASKVETDITEDTLRELFLPTGLVDNKVCAIDETWSGLRFVVRRENRPGWNQPSQ